MQMMIHTLGDSMDDVIKSPEDDTINLFKWFQDNQMKANSDKCYWWAKLHESKYREYIENSTCEKLLGVKVDNKLSFNEHLDGIIKKESGKVSALSRIFPQPRVWDGLKHIHPGANWVDVFFMQFIQQVSILNTS